MGQKPVPPVTIAIPTKIGSEMGGEFAFHPQPYGLGVSFCSGAPFYLVAL